MPRVSRSRRSVARPPCRTRATGSSSPSLFVHRSSHRASAASALPVLVSLLLLVPGGGVLPLAIPAQATSEGEPFDPPGLGTGPYSEMSTLMEVTIFGIDVLTLTVRLPPEVGERLGELTAGRSYSKELADSVAAVVLATEDLWSRQVFEREAGLQRLLDGMRETSEKALEAGYIGRAHHEEFVDRLSEMFAFLEDRGIHEGDEVFLRVRGDTVRNLYRTGEGEVLMDRSVVDPEARRGSVPGFFAPGTPFREGLVKSLIQSPSAPR